MLDAQTKLSADQQVTADAVSGNYFDSHAITPQRDMGRGEPMGVKVSIKAAGTNTGSAIISLICSAATNLGSPKIVGQLELEAADLAAGKEYVIAQSYGKVPLRYIGVDYNITGTVDFTVDAYYSPLSMLNIKPQLQAKGYTVS